MYNSLTKEINKRFTFSIVIVIRVKRNKSPTFVQKHHPTSLEIHTFHLWESLSRCGSCSILSLFTSVSRRYRFSKDRCLFLDEMKITFAIALLAIAVFKESHQQCFPPYVGRQPSKTGHLDLYSGQQEFSLALLSAINKVLPNDNLFFSPYSTYHALLMAYFLSGKQTEQYLKKVLRLNPNQVCIYFIIILNTSIRFTD